MTARLSRLQQLLLCSWGALLLSGIAGIGWWNSQPGLSASSPARWPAGSVFLRSTRKTLIVFLHPQCPCSRATVRVLERLAARLHGRVDMHALLLVPGSSPKGEAPSADAFTTSNLLESLDAIPGLLVHTDPGAREAKRFGATTSGHVVLYDEAGRLRFAGGITASRGHEGDSDALAALAQQIDRPAAMTTLDQIKTATLGCPLFSKEP